MSEKQFLAGKEVPLAVTVVTTRVTSGIHVRAGVCPVNPARENVQAIAEGCQFLAAFFYNPAHKAT